jgi:hypothetical protein
MSKQFFLAQDFSAQTPYVLMSIECMNMTRTNALLQYKKFQKIKFLGILG